jgi:hypothetical protein
MLNFLTSAVKTAALMAEINESVKLLRDRMDLVTGSLPALIARVGELERDMRCIEDEHRQELERLRLLEIDFRGYMSRKSDRGLRQS